MILVDAHVHIYDCFELDKFLDAAYANFKSEADRLGYDFIGILLLAEAAKQNYFYQLNKLSRGEIVDVNLIFDKWTFYSTKENCSILAKSDKGERLLIISGRQIVTEENMEVLALCTDEKIQDGVPIEEILETILKNDGIPVIPWGCGKWIGRRGKIVNKILKSSGKLKIYLGDNGGRPSILPIPSQFEIAKENGIQVLPGSDPLPLESELGRVGSFGFRHNVTLSVGYPANDLKNLLLQRSDPVQLYGQLQPPFRFLSNQIKLRLLS